MCFHVILKNKRCLIVLLITNLFQILFQRNYSNDIFLLFLSELHVGKFLNYMNYKHRNIMFTIDCGEYNSPTFLDVNIFHDSGKFHKTVNRNHIFGDVLTNIERLISILYKYLISTLLHRGLLIC